MDKSTLESLNTQQLDLSLRLQSIEQKLMPVLGQLVLQKRLSKEEESMLLAHLKTARQALSGEH